MENTCIFKIVAIALIASGVARAAIDDAGMRYVSAAEGLSGSIRIKLYEESSDQFDDPELSFGNSRIVYKGENEIGNGTAATYFFEFRPGDPSLETGSEAGSFSIKYIDVGLKGSFGHFRMGSIESASSAMLPSADRSSADLSTTGENIASDYENGGLRWVSPSINGLMVGLSAAMFDDNQVAGKEDKKVDQYDVALVYNLKGGMNIGASYAVKQLHITANRGTRDYERSEGYRLGFSYADRAGWGIGYNFHKYNGHAPKNFTQGVEGRASGEVDGRRNRAIIENHKDTEYVEHVVGANLNVGKFGFAANYSRANSKNGTLNTIESINNVFKGVDVNFISSTFDTEYRMGSKSRIIATIQKTEAQGENLISTIDAAANEGDKDSKRYYLLYRVDF